MLSVSVLCAVFFFLFSKPSAVNVEVLPIGQVLSLSIDGAILILFHRFIV